MTTTSSRVHVALAENSYDIHIGHDLFTATANDLSVLLKNIEYFFYRQA